MPTSGNDATYTVEDIIEDIHQMQWTARKTLWRSLLT